MQVPKDWQGFDVNFFEQHGFNTGWHDFKIGNTTDKKKQILKNMA